MISALPTIAFYAATDPSSLASSPRTSSNGVSATGHQSPSDSSQRKTCPHNFSYDSGTAIARVAVLEDLGPSIPQITTMDFLTFLAPPKPAFDLNGTMEQLNHAGIIVSDRWSAFDIDPTDQPTDENDTFSHLVDIFDAVVDAIVANSEGSETPIVQLLQNPNKPLKSTTIANATKPDGCLVLKMRPEEDLVRWADVVLSCEYKKKLRPITQYDVSIRRGLEMCCAKLPSP